MEFHINTSAHTAHTHTHNDIGKIDKEILHSHHMASPNYTYVFSIHKHIVVVVGHSQNRSKAAEGTSQAVICAWQRLLHFIFVFVFSISLFSFFHSPIQIYTIFGTSRVHNTFDQILKSDLICSSYMFAHFSHCIHLTSTSSFDSPLALFLLLCITIICFCTTPHCIFVCVWVSELNACQQRIDIQTDKNQQQPAHTFGVYYSFFIDYLSVIFATIFCSCPLHAMPPM